MPNVLLLSYVFPPFFSVGGSIRVVKFLKYLPSCGWRPVVLTIDDQREYDTQRKEGSAALLQELPPEVKVYRTAAGEPPAALLEHGRRARQRGRAAALAVNSLRELRRWANQYLLLPDEQIAWLPFALRAGRRIVREEQIDVIFATCPPHSVALIGAALKLLTGKPLMLDYRDDWIDTPWYSRKPWFARQAERRLERWAVRTADRVVLVTEWSQRAFLARYPHEPQAKFVLVTNGCDLEDYDPQADLPPRAADAPFTVVHAGLLSDAEDWKRDPEALFQALCRIRRHQPELGKRMQVVFTGHLPPTYRRRADDLGLADVVREAGHLPREQLIRLLQSADALLTINYAGFETLIPGKIYDYWAIGGPPILLLSCPGAAQSLIERYKLGLCVSPDDPIAIQNALLGLHQRAESKEPLRVQRAGIEAYDRRALTARLSQTLAQTATR